MPSSAETTTARTLYAAVARRPRVVAATKGEMTVRERAC
jgi:hypothetical protein